MKNKFLLLTFNIFLQIYFLQAQHTAPLYPEVPTKGTITGKVFDKSDNKPVEYANVALYKSSDLSLVSGTITNAEGMYAIKDIPWGEYFITIKYIGYFADTVKNIILNPENPVYKSNPVTLKPSVTELEGVEVIANKPIVEYKIDKKVIDVSQDINSKGGTAVDALQNAPSIEVDIEGNVKLRGSENFTVLINGKPSPVDGTDALQQIPSGSIKNIEIITNPSAKYDPDGTAGIINVILKNDARRGFSGIVNLSAGVNDKYAGNISLNYNMKKVNLFTNFDFTDQQMLIDIYHDRTSWNNDTNEYMHTDVDLNIRRKSLKSSTGLEYNPNDMNQFIFSMDWGTRDILFSNKSFITYYTSPSTFTEYLRSNSNFTRTGEYLSPQLTYTKKFNDLGHQLVFNGYYESQVATSDKAQEDYKTDISWLPVNSSVSQQTSSEDEEGWEARVQLDYTLPLANKRKLEAGIQSRLENETETYGYFDFDTLTSIWTENNRSKNTMDFKRNIHSTYVMFSEESDKFQYQLGLRGELTDREIGDQVRNLTYSIYRFDFFPTLHFMKPLPKDFQLQANYTKRINRPSGRNLELDTTYMNSYNLRVGNPDLNPEYMNSFELNIQKNIKKSYVALETYFRNTYNKIERIQQLMDDGYIIHKEENVGKDYTLGVELMANLVLSKRFTTNLSTSAYHYLLKVETATEKYDRNNYSWYGRLNNTLRLFPNNRVQLNFAYQGPSLTSLGQMEGYFTSDLGIRQDFLNKKMSATLRFMNMFNTQKREYYSYGDNYELHHFSTMEYPVFILSLNYTINNFKKEKEKMDNERGDEDMSF